MNFTQNHKLNQSFLQITQARQNIALCLIAKQYSTPTDKPDMQDEYALRRQRLMAAIGPQSIAIVPAAAETRRNSDVDHLFRQNSDFMYLTGFNEPDAVLVLAPGNPNGDVSIFVHPRDPAREQWTGLRLGKTHAPEVLRVNQAFELSELRSAMPALLEGRDTVHTVWNVNKEFDDQLRQWISGLKGQRKPGPSQWVQLDLTLHELRVMKSDLELEVMQQAANISVAAHEHVMQFCKPGITEQRLESELLYEFSSRGARHVAYPCIVASGSNACIMHYVENNRMIQDGDLVLIDAGCEVDCYASDITRTFPSNGRFSSHQREIYQLVLEAQRQAIDSIRPGTTFVEPHNVARRVMIEGLIELKILDASLDEAIDDNLAQRFLVHGCSHWLGMDVHDVGKSQVEGKSRSLEAGMVMTVEPGIYIQNTEEMSDVDECWRGIGVRVEDDVCVTQKGNKVLTGALAKSTGDIESLMNG